MECLISFGICKAGKICYIIQFTDKAIKLVPIDLNSSRFITYAPSFILDKLFLE